MTLVLDTGALIQVDRGNRHVLSMIETALDRGERVHVPAGVIGQAWRDPSRQARSSRALRRCDEVDLTGSRARASGQLCGEAGLPTLWMPRWRWRWQAGGITTSRFSRPTRMT